jgi:hypothetical protein
MAVAQAEKPAQPGKEHGQCTAYFNGHKNGWGEGHPPGFDDLVAAADSSDDGNPTTLQELFDYCTGYGIGGNPDQNGRFVDCFAGDDSCPEQPA